MTPTPPIRTTTTEETDTFERVARLVASRSDRRGFTLPELATVGALSRELAAEDPDRARLQELATDLGLTDTDLETLDTPSTPEAP